MKKMFALMLAVLLLVSMVPTAMAYTAPTLESKTFNHTLTLTYPYDKFESEDVTITYKYTVENAKLMVTTPTDDQTATPNYTYTYVTPASGVVSGVPSIEGNYTDSNNSKAYAVFNKDSSFDSNKVSTVVMTANFENVTITEPGIYVWKVTKALDATLTTAEGATTNEDGTLYLYAIVTRTNDDTLACSNYGVSEYESLEKKTAGPEDQYPAKKLSLTVKKEIAGNMASSNQYFSFKISLATNAGTYTITIYDADGQEITDTAVPATAYNSAQTNETSVVVSATNTENTATIWLKAGEYATISNLPFGSSYTIIEGNNTDYTSVSATITTGDTTPNLSNVATDYTVTDDSLTSDTTVTYTNTKNATVPTGITLNTAAPVAGILLAISLLGILFIGKRKEYAA